MIYARYLKENKKVFLFFLVTILFAIFPIMVHAEEIAKETDLSNYPYGKMTDLKVAENIMKELNDAISATVTDEMENILENSNKVSNSTPDVIHTLEIPMGHEFTFEFIPFIEGNFYYVGDATDYSNGLSQTIDYGSVTSSNSRIATVSRSFANQYTRNNNGSWINDNLITNWGCKNLNVTINALSVGTTNIDVFYHLSNTPYTGSTYNLLLAQNVHERIVVTVYDPNDAEHTATLSIGQKEDFISNVTYNNSVVSPSEIVFDTNGEPSYNGSVIKLSSPTGLNTWIGTKAGQTIVGFNAQALKPGNAFVKTSYGYYKQLNRDYLSNGYQTFTFNFTELHAYIDAWNINVLGTPKYTVTYTDGVSGQVIFPDESYDGLKAGETTPPFSGGTPTRSGYTFMGWSPTINKYVSGDHANKNGEIIYTATWKKLKISNFNKELVKSPNNVPNGLNVTGITYPNTEGKVTLPGNGSPITLLFKITVTGEIGAKYSVTDTGATYVGGDPMEGTLKTQIATIYVTRSYNKNDVNENGNLINTAMIIPGKNEESSSTSTETVPALIEKDQTTYTVSWYDDNKKTVLATLTYKEGEKEPAYNGKVPTKPDDKNYSYKFSGWIKQENPLNNDTVSYVAQYGAIVKDVTYKVEWYDEKGNVLSSEIRTGVLGSIVSVTDSDKVIDGYIFMEDYENNNLSGEVDENGNVVLKLYFKTNKDNAINTGDNSHTILYIVLCVVSLGIIAGLVFILKKKNMKKN